MSSPGCLSAVSTAHLSSPPPPPMAAVGLGLGGAMTGCSRLLSPLHRRSSRRRHVVRMAPEEEKITRRSPLDFPIEWERPKPGRRPDIFPQFSPMKSPLPTPLPADPPEEDEEEEEEEKKEEEEEDPNKEEPEQPDKQQSRMEKRGGWWP